MAKKDDKTKSLYRPPSSEITLGADLDDLVEYINLPEWWTTSTGLPGIPYRKLVQIAGDSDSGKTSFSISCIKAAQEQGATVLYVETENKTTKRDLEDWGVDVNKIYFLKEAVAESIYDKVYKFIIDRKEKLLVVIDSAGNVLSKDDLDRTLAESNSRPGGKGKSNREGLKRLIQASMYRDVALLIVNYTYDNLGSPGKTNAGGKALNFFSSLTYQTSRKGWLEKTVKGEKIRIGAKVQWKLFKNHLNRSAPGAKVIEFDITKDGMKLAGVSNE